MWAFDDVSAVNGRGAGDYSSAPSSSASLLQQHLSSSSSSSSPIAALPQRTSRFNTAAWTAAENTNTMHSIASPLSSALANCASPKDSAASSYSSLIKPRPSAAVPPTTTSTARDVCKFFTSGGCLKGVDCPFSHDLTVAAESQEAAKAGFMFVGSVANVNTGASSRTSTPTSIGGLNPEAPAFLYGGGSDPENYGALYHAPQGASYAGPYAAPQELPSSWHPQLPIASHGSYYGAAAEMLGEPLPDHRYPTAGTYDTVVSAPMPSVVCPVTPPSYTTRRRIPDGAVLAPPPVFQLPPMDYESRQQQAMRPALDTVISTVKVATNSASAAVMPSSRPRPPLQTLHTAQGAERFVPFAGVA